MSIHAKRSSMIMIMMMLCTVTIIWTNYIFTQNIINDANQQLIEKEYDKIWWKENYMLLQEIQKREILWYIEKIKKEQPELVDEILNKKSQYEILNIEIRNDLKKDVSIFGSSWALVTLIEFSDLECDFCITQHSKWITSKILEKFDGKVNYIFKNFPLPAHKNSKLGAEAAKCIENISWKEKYIEFINTIFKTMYKDWEWYNLEKLTNLAIKIWTNKEKFNACLSNQDTKEIVEKEFIQWRMLWINSVPANMLINNKTWEYIIIFEETSYENIEKIILDISE